MLTGLPSLHYLWNTAQDPQVPLEKPLGLLETQILQVPTLWSRLSLQRAKWLKSQPWQVTGHIR